MFMVLGRKQTLNYSSTLFSVWASDDKVFSELTKRHEDLQSHKQHSDHLRIGKSIELQNSQFG